MVTYQVECFKHPSHLVCASCEEACGARIHHKVVKLYSVQGADDKLEDTCSVCENDLETSTIPSIYKTTCGHRFHRLCFENYLSKPCTTYFAVCPNALIAQEDEKKAMATTEKAYKMEQAFKLAVKIIRGQAPETEKVIVKKIVKEVFCGGEANAKLDFHYEKIWGRAKTFVKGGTVVLILNDLGHWPKPSW